MIDSSGTFENAKWEMISQTPNDDKIRPYGLLISSVG